MPSGHQGPGVGRAILAEMERNLLHCSSGGHPPPLIWRRTPTAVEEIPPGGPLLGRFADARFASSEVRLEPGDRILLFTDGVFEAASDSEELFGEERLNETLATHSGLAAEGFADAVLDHLARWTKSPSDDLTQVVIDVEQAPVPGS